MTIRHRTECRKTSPGRSDGGFTLIEMMTAIVILAILVGLTVPSFREASLSGRLTGYANDIVASAQLARSEAIKRNAPVTMCASAAGATCDTTDGWEVGWIVLADSGVVSRHPPVTQEFRITQDDGTTTDIVFPPTVVGVTDTEFIVCRADPVGSQERVVTISAVGSTRVEHTEDGTCPETE